MPDTGQNIRAAKTNIGEPGFGLVPAVHTENIGQPVHQFNMQTGLEGLNQVLSDFLGTLSHSVDSVQAGVNYGREQQIQQENAAQKRQAVGDALEGKPMDAKLTKDLDYYDAYRTVTAQKDGFAAANDFTDWYAQKWLPEHPTGDLMQARQEWAAKNLSGSEDKAYEGQVLAAFFDHTDPLIGKQREFALKYQTAQGMQNLGAAIDGAVASGTMDAGKLSSFIDMARVLDPLNSPEAPSRVSSVLLAAAQNHPEQMMAISSLLGQDGTGVNGKSFAASWPDVYSDFQNKAVSAWSTVNSLQDQQAITSFEDRLRNAGSVDDLTSLTADVMKFRQQRGAVNQTSSLLNAIGTQMVKIDKQETTFSGIDQFLGGNTGAVSPSDIRSNWSDWLASRFQVNNILDLPQDVSAKLVQSLAGVVPEEVKTQLSAAITGTGDTAKQAQAITIMDALTATTGKAYAKTFLSDPAAQLYQNVSAIAAATNEPIDQIVAHVNDSRNGVKDWGVDWKTVTGADTEANAEKSVTDAVNKSLRAQLGQQGWLGGLLLGAGGSTPVVPANLMSTIMDAARVKAIEAQANGRGWQAGVNDAIEEVAATSEVIPGANGQTFLRLKADQTARYIGDDGKDAVRPLLGHSVVNPTTGMPVDTLSVYNGQLDQLAKSNPWALPSGKTDGVSLNPAQSYPMAAHGVFEVQQDGLPIIYASGTKVTIPGAENKDAVIHMGPVSLPNLGATGAASTTEVTIPDTEAGMEKTFSNLPEGFKFLRQDTPQGVVWRLTYRPNFGDQTGRTLDQQADAFRKANGGGW